MFRAGEPASYTGKPKRSAGQTPTITMAYDKIQRLKIWFPVDPVGSVR